MLELVLGRYGSGKTQHLYTQIKEKIDLGIGDLVLLVPEQYSHAAERELAKLLGPKSNMFVEVLSFKRLSNRVENELGGAAKKSLDEGGRILAMRLALEAVHPQLKLYKSINRKPEFLSSLLDTLDELKQHTIDPPHLLDLAIHVEGKLQDKLHDLAYLLAAYTRISGRLDPRDKLTKLADSIENSSFTRSHFFIDGFSDFTAQESLVLRKLLRFGASISLSLTCGGLWDDSPIFKAPVHTAKFFKDFSENLGKTVTLTHCTQENKAPKALTQIEKYLFSNAPLESLPTTTQEGLHLFSAQNPLDECKQAAAYVAYLVREKGYRYWDIAVSVRGFTDYEHMLESTFSYYGIPCHISRKVNLLDKPILQILMGALNILDTNWNYNAVFPYLRTGLLDISQEEIDLLDCYVKQYHIQGSKWTQKKPWKDHPHRFGHPFSPADETLLAQINSLRKRVTAPLKTLQKAAKAGKTAKEHIFSLYHFLEDIHLAETLLTKANYLKQTQREVLAAEYTQIWDILISALEQALGILGDSPMEFTEFSSLMRLCLSQYQIGTIPQTVDRVHLGDLDKIRRRDLKCLIVLGATDKRLPSPNPQAGVFTDFERQWLLENRMPLSGTAEESVYLEYALIYHSFSLAKDKLVIGFPNQDNSGEENRKSPLLHRIAYLCQAVEAPLLPSGLLYHAPKPAFDLALQKFTLEPELAAMARAYFSTDQRQKMLEKQISTEESALSPEKTAALYGSPLVLSPSRLAQFSSCPFRFFMEYGLKAKTTKQMSLDAPMQGTFIHYLLEKISHDIIAQGGFRREGIDLSALTQKHIAGYKATYLENLSEQTKRFQYLFANLSHNSVATVSDMAEEMYHSAFSPLAFELTFGKNKSLPPISFSNGDTNILLQGTVDRVDGFVHKEHLHLRIIDYKTGKAKFSLSDIWHGHNMQLLLYLFALGKNGRDFFGDLPLSPAGVLYLPARESVPSLAKNSSPSLIVKEQEKEKRRSGLILNEPDIIKAMEENDPPRYLPIGFSKDGALKETAGGLLLSQKELTVVEKHVEEKVLSLADEIAGGNTLTSPVTGSINSPCDYCDFRLACHHDPSVHGFRYLPKLSKEEIFASRQKGGK